jgi:hypothetical protein
LRLQSGFFMPVIWLAVGEADKRAYRSRLD